MFPCEQALNFTPLGVLISIFFWIFCFVFWLLTMFWQQILIGSLRLLHCSLSILNSGFSEATMSVHWHFWITCYVEVCSYWSMFTLRGILSYSYAELFMYYKNDWLFYVSHQVSRLLSFMCGLLLSNTIMLPCTQRTKLLSQNSVIFSSGFLNFFVEFDMSKSLGDLLNLLVHCCFFLLSWLCYCCFQAFIWSWVQIL